MPEDGKSIERMPQFSMAALCNYTCMNNYFTHLKCHSWGGDETYSNSKFDEQMLQCFANNNDFNELNVRIKESLRVITYVGMDYNRVIGGY